MTNTTWADVDPEKIKADLDDWAARFTEMNGVKPSRLNASYKLAVIVYRTGWPVDFFGGKVRMLSSSKREVKLLARETKNDPNVKVVFARHGEPGVVFTADRS